MAVTGGKVTLKVEADIEQLKRQLQAAGYHVSKFNGEMDKASKSIAKSGDQAAASAVNFQTLTQGAINLTTAFVQTETTISNLTKAQTSLKAAMVGVERAEDLLARKEVQLNEERKKAVPNMDKIKLLTNEIRTGYKDLEVKTDRVRDQQDQLNDTYKLFALNLLNVSFSALQTTKSLIDWGKQAEVANKVTKALGSSMGKVTIIALAAVVAWETLVGHFKIFGEEASKTLTISGRLNQMFSDMSNVSLKNYDDMVEKTTANQVSFNNAISKTSKELGGLKTIYDQQIKAIKELQNVSDPQKMKLMLDLMRSFGVSGGGVAANFPSGVASVTPEKKQKGVNSNVTETSQGVSFNPDGTTNNDVYEMAQESLPNEIGIPGILPAAYPDTGTVGQPSYQTWTNTGGVTGRVANGRYTGKVLRYAVPKTSPMELYETRPPVADFSVFLNDQERSVYQNFNDGKFNIFDTSILNYGFGPAKSTLSPTFRLLSPMTKLQILSQINLQGGIIGEYGKMRSLTSEESRMLYQELLKIDPFKETQDYAIEFQAGGSGFGLPSPSQQYQGLLKSFSDTFLTKGTQIDGGMSYSLKSNVVIRPPKLAPGVASWLKREPYIKRNDEFYREAEKLKQAAVSDYFSQFDNMLVDANRAIGYGGIGGKIIADALFKDRGLYDTNYFGQGTAGMGRKVVSTELMKALEQAQLEYQAKYGPRVPVPRRTNVDVSGFAVDNGFANAAALSTYGAVSSMPSIYGGAARFGQAAVSAGMVSVSEAGGPGVGGAWRFAQRNAQALAARRAEIAREDAWRNSVIGQNARVAYSLLTGSGSASYSRNVARRGGLLNPDMSRTFQLAGFLGIGASYTEFETTASDLYSSVRPQLDALIKEKGLKEDFLYAGMISAYQIASDEARSRLPYGFSGIRNVGISQDINRNVRNQTSRVLSNFVSRIAAGNIGIYDATILNAMTGAVVSELAHETSVFYDKISPVLGIAHNDFKTTLVDAKRGINEIDDRIRWTQRLEQISTGATVF